MIVLFTDGRTTAGGNATPVAVAAKAQGIIIYCIGLTGSDGIDEQSLNVWASSPPASYVAITPDDQELETLFEDLAKNIAKPGATNIVINEEVNPCFQITSISNPTKGTANITGARSLEWKIDELGVTNSEGTVLEFTVAHVGACAGTVEVNNRIDYSDAEGNQVSFPSPEIEIDCSIVVTPEECPTRLTLPSRDAKTQWSSTQALLAWNPLAGSYSWMLRSKMCAHASAWRLQQLLRRSIPVALSTSVA